jgi:UDP-glucose 4-epimerase
MPTSTNHHVLVTGGAGYIGSHAALRLLRDGHHVTIIDNLDRGHAGAVEAIARAAAKNATNLTFHKLDLLDTLALEHVLRAHHVQAVMHFAALTYVGESVNRPLDYWRVNTAGALSLLTAAHNAGVTRLIFSSTAATYGEPAPTDVPIKEDLTQRPINPYGASKLAFERILTEHTHAATAAGRDFAAAFLRYFNVAGCDRAGALGEHHDPETHLIPIILQCLLARRPQSNNTLSIFGTDYPTPDGTAVRDYVHVEDLVDAHVHTLAALKPGDVRSYNIATGTGLSVRQIVDAAQRVTGLTLKTVNAPRRAGDPATLYADPSKIAREIGWKAATTSVETMIEHAWTWMKANPKGYST